MNLLNFIKRILARFINIPRKIRQVYYICWNYFMLWANGVEIGKNMKIYNRIYLTKHPTAHRLLLAIIWCLLVVMDLIRYAVI